MGPKHTTEFRHETVRIALTSDRPKMTEELQKIGF